MFGQNTKGGTLKLIEKVQAVTQGVTYLSPPQSKTITTGINIIF